MNLENKLSQKEINYLNRKFRITRNNWMFYGIISGLGLFTIYVILHIVFFGCYADIGTFNVGVLSFIDIGLFYVYLGLTPYLFMIFEFMMHRKFMLIIDGLQMTNLETVVLQDEDYKFLQGLSLWLNKKSWRFWTPIITLLLLTEIGREIYVDWGFRADSLMFIAFLFPTLSILFLIMESSKMIKIIEKIYGASIQLETRQEQ
ncbi:MAG: hypothetical protein KKH28_09150 [Elusimicrobia bacterium]|nr:hypothetical protein [Elusimicrobiota bacterium]